MPVTNKNESDERSSRQRFSRRNVCGAAAADARCHQAARAPIDPVVQADRTRVQALEKGNGPAAGKLLDADFSWIDSEGIMWAWEDAFRAAPAQTM